MVLGFVLALCSWVADSCFSSRIVGRVVLCFTGGLDGSLLVLLL